MNSVVIWGRDNSVNVQKVLWCCEEIGLPYVRIDAGGGFVARVRGRHLRRRDHAIAARAMRGRMPTDGIDGDEELAVRTEDEHAAIQSRRARRLQ